MESRRPFTLDHIRFSISKEAFITEFAHQRLHLQSPVPSPSSTTHTIRDTYGTAHSITSRGVDEDVLLSLLTVKGYRVTSLKQLARLKDPDEYETELGVISQVLAYFEISSKRIIDLMPMVFETVFARNFENELRNVLTSNLKLVGDVGVANCVRYTQDEQDVQRKREDFNKTKEILSQASEIISRFYK